MVALAQTDFRAEMDSHHPVVDVVVPVYNEERDLGPSIRRLRAYVDEHLPWEAVVTIADNGSTDGTGRLADELATELGGVRVVHLDRKGRGLALRTAWSASDARVVAYMDVDLSTSLDALLPLVAPLVSGHSDLAIGTRLARGARVTRGPKRELISRAYNLILRASLRNEFSDAQCGFKAVRADVARALVPLVADDEWFFDTELLVLAERADLRIHEVPVDWVDDPDSRVHLLRTATDDLVGVLRLLRTTARHPLSAGRPAAPAQLAARFARVGVVSTVAFCALFLALRAALGDYGADLLALAPCTAANAAANARYTFAGGRPLRAGRVAAAGAAAWAVSAAMTTLAVLLLQAAGVGSLVAVVAALVAANAVAVAARFALLHAWMFPSAPALPTTRTVP